MGNLVEDGWRESSRTPRGAPASRCAGSESEFGKGLLRVDGTRCKNEADSKNDREPNQPHGHLVGDGWRESSRPAACQEALAALVGHALLDDLIRSL
jgi:hypothetical protein